MKTAPDPIWVRVGWRVRRLVRTCVMWPFGRPIRCASCDLALFRGIPVVWRGRVWLIGAAQSDVRVSFDGRSSLRFHHLWLHKCPSPDRPWAG